MFGLPLRLPSLSELVIVLDQIRQIVQISGCVLALILTRPLTLVSIADQGVKVHDCLIALPFLEHFMAGIDGSIIDREILGLELELVLFLTIYNFRDNLRFYLQSRVDKFVESMLPVNVVDEDR